MTKILTPEFAALREQIDHIERGGFQIPDDEPQMAVIYSGYVTQALKRAVALGITDEQTLINSGDWPEHTLPDMRQIQATFEHIRTRLVYSLRKEHGQDLMDSIWQP